MKCPVCEGNGMVDNPIRKAGVMQKLTCANCKGTGKLSKFQSAQMKGQLEQLKEKVESLKLSRDDLIARATDLQGNLNAMKNEVSQAVELAEFYEKQGLENERLVGVFKEALGVLVEFALSTVVGEFPKTIRELASFYREKIPLPNPPLVDDGATDCKCAMPEQVLAEDETRTLEPEKDKPEDGSASVKAAFDAIEAKDCIACMWLNIKEDDGSSCCDNCKDKSDFERLYAISDIEKRMNQKGGDEVVE